MRQSARGDAPFPAELYRRASLGKGYRRAALLTGAARASAMEGSLAQNERGARNGWAEGCVRSRSKADEAASEREIRTRIQ